MAQLNEMVDSLNLLQHQISIEQLKSENDHLKRENNQLKLDANQVKYDNDRRFNLLNDEVNNLKSHILDYFLQSTTTTSEHTNKRICQKQTNQTKKITTAMNVDIALDANYSAFASMPDDAIRLIFFRLTLQDRVLLRIICSRWKSIIESMCRSVRLLKVFGPKFDYHKEAAGFNFLLIDYKRNVLAQKFPKDITQIQFIPQLFCNVDQVVLCFAKAFDITIMQLLEAWADRLASLTMDIEVSEYIGPVIWHLITQMPKLKSLSMDKNICSSYIPNSELTFLKQLEQLKIGWCPTWTMSHRIFRFICPYMRRLELQATYHDFNIYKAIQENPICVTNVTHFKHSIAGLCPSRHNRYSEINKKSFEIVCRLFVSLAELELDFLIEVRFRSQLTQLSQLSHLTKVHLHMTYDHFDDLHFCSIQFATLQSLVLNIWMNPSTPRQINLKPEDVMYRTQIGHFLNEIPRMFPVLKELKIVARNQFTIQFLEQLIYRLDFKSCKRIKYELIELL